MSNLKQLLSERVMMSASVLDGSSWGDTRSVSRRDRTLRRSVREHIPHMRWDDCAKHYLASRQARDSPLMQVLHGLLETRRYDEVRDELARAELAGQLSEFHALNFHAILAIVEGSELAGDYLEMVEAVAATPYELAVVAENQAAHDLLRGNPLSAARRCVATLDHGWQTEGLWNNLLVALHRLGEVDMVDATLRAFVRLDCECVARLVGLISSEPGRSNISVKGSMQLSTSQLEQHRVSLNGG